MEDGLGPQTANDELQFGFSIGWISRAEGSYNDSGTQTRDPTRHGPEA